MGVCVVLLCFYFGFVFWDFFSKEENRFIVSEGLYHVCHDKEMGGPEEDNVIIEAVRMTPCVHKILFIFCDSQH